MSWYGIDHKVTIRSQGVKTRLGIKRGTERGWDPLFQKILDSLECLFIRIKGSCVNRNFVTAEVLCNFYSLFSKNGKSVKRWFIHPDPNWKKFGRKISQARRNKVGYLF